MLPQPVLATIRAALCDRIDAEALRQQRLATPDVSMPSSLLAASLWLADRGWLDGRRAMTEAVTAIVRAGAGIVITYAAADLATWIRDER